MTRGGLGIGALWLAGLMASGCFTDIPASRPRGEGGAGGGQLGQGATGPGPGGSGGCAADLADCDGDGECETDLSSDKDNCDACGRDCLGASCVARRCQPIQLRPGQTFPHYIAVDEDHVFWTSGGEGQGTGTVRRCNKNGTAPRDLVEMAAKPRGLALDDTYVYWSDGIDGSLHRVRKDETGGDELLVSGLMSTQAGEGFVLLHQDRLYWSHGNAGSLRSARLDGSDVQLHASGQPSPRQMAIVGDELYFTVGEPELRRVPLAGGPVEVLPNISDVHFTFGIIALDGAIVLRASDFGAGLEGRVMQFDPTDDSFTLLAESIGARDIAADAQHLYWVSDAGRTVERARYDGSEQTSLAEGQVDPTGIVVDDEAVYWTNRALGAPGAGSIFKVAK